MPTFGIVVSAEEFAPMARKTARVPKDTSFLEPYRDALGTLQSEAPGSRMLIDIGEGEEYKTMRTYLNRVAREKGLVVGIDKLAGTKTQFGVWIVPGEKPKPTAYDLLSAEAKSRGMTVAALRAEKAAEKGLTASESTGKRGRPRKSVETPELATV